MNEWCKRNGHDWGEGKWAGVCTRCGHGAADGRVAREKNAKQAQKEREERYREHGS